VKIRVRARFGDACSAMREPAFCAMHVVLCSVSARHRASLCACR
jgi:hypothetical protein